MTLLNKYFDLTDTQLAVYNTDVHIGGILMCSFFTILNVLAQVSHLTKTFLNSFQKRNRENSKKQYKQYPWPP